MPSLPAVIPTSAHSLPYPGLSFITFGDPGQSRLPHQRKAVRSHAASYQHHLDKTSSAKHASGTRLALSSGSQRRQGRRRKCHITVTLDLNIPDTTQPEHAIGLIEPHTPSPLGILGEGRVDPFRTYPVPWEPFLPGLIDHCRRSFQSFCFDCLDAEHPSGIRLVGIDPD
jgi:hypothetical protein